MRMCDVAGCTHCPSDGLSVELPKTQKYSDTAMAQHMKRLHRPQDRRSQDEWKQWHELHFPGCFE
jgi:hypothetical protein